MNELDANITATKINLHQKSKILELAFSDGMTFNFPCEYLRVFACDDTNTSRNAAATIVCNKARVNISAIEANGKNGLAINFDDGFHGAIFSWSDLYQLALDYPKKWQLYLAQLEELNLTREQAGDNEPAEKTITLLYFMQLANIAQTSSETSQLPATIHTVKDLLLWLQSRSQVWKQAFTEQKVQVTVNKQFTESYTPISEGDEVALIPRKEP